MASKKPRILIVDDDQSLCKILANLLNYEGYDTDMVHEGKLTLPRLKKHSFDLMLLDLKLPDMSGLEVLEKVANLNKGVQVVMISGQGTINIAVEATRKGAYDFLEKPLDTERVLVTLRNALARGQLEKERAHLVQSVKERYMMVWESKVMEEVQDLILKASSNNCKVLIEGENGTGKELVARAIHINSSRSGKPFVAVNCAAIPDTLIESELFGHKKGAFTGALEDKLGRFQQAEGGTLFLDEIGDMSLMTQAKVLRALEEDVVEMVGGSKPVTTDVRVIAATNKNIQEEMAKGTFREDLFFRLNVFSIRVPPLRERKDDIPLLIDHFICRCCEEHGVARKSITKRARNRLMRYAWPGNVRELKNFIEKLIFFVETPKVDLEHVTGLLTSYSVMPKKKKLGSLTLKEARLEFEKEFIQKSLSACKGNVSSAADRLGIPRTYLYKKMKTLGMKVS